MSIFWGWLSDGNILLLIYARICVGESFYSGICRRATLLKRGIQIEIITIWFSHYHATYAWESFFGGGINFSFSSRKYPEKLQMNCYFSPLFHIPCHCLRSLSLFWPTPDVDEMMKNLSIKWKCFTKIGRGRWGILPAESKENYNPKKLLCNKIELIFEFLFYLLF